MFSIESLALLVVVLPSSICSAPTSKPQVAAEVAFNQYKISATEVRSIDAVDPIKHIAGRINSLTFTICGIKPDDTPIACSGEWIHEMASNATSFAKLTCTDDGMYADVTQTENGSEGPTPEIHSLSINLQHRELLPAIWKFHDDDRRTWACEARGALCTLKSWIAINSLPQSEVPEVLRATPDIVKTDDNPKEGKQALREAGKEVKANLEAFEEL